MQVHQWLAGFATGDAISNEALAIRDALRKKGIKSEIFCVNRHISPKVRHLAKDYKEYVNYSNEDNIVIYHFSIGSEMSQPFSGLRDKKIIRYHNITPDKYFRYINDEKALVLHQGREELYSLKDIPSLSIAASEYSAEELRKAGFKNVQVLPIVVDFEKLKDKYKKSIVRQYRGSFKNLFFVGRIAPHKKIEDVIKVFYYYKNTVNIYSRLIIVGSFVGMEKYYAYLRSLVREMVLPEVFFTGHVTDEELRAYFRVADLFLCMSEHEGFCVPLLECMYFDIPVIAYGSSAVPSTMNGAGIMIERKDYRITAELIDIVFKDNRLKDNLIQNQRRRIQDLSNEKITDRLCKYLDLGHFSG